jgi:hypothetical protein
MKRQRRVVSDRIRVSVSRKTGITLTDFERVVALHQALNEINKMKRLLFSPLHFIAETDGIL